MKTAKEWLRNLAKETGQQPDVYEGGVSCMVDTQELIARDIEVMEEAVKLVEKEDWVTGEPRSSLGGLAIRRHIAELKKELEAL